MEIILLIVGVIAIIHLVRQWRRWVYQRQLGRLAVNHARQAAMRAHARDLTMRRAASAMQSEILHLAGTPDFRRAAAAARMAAELQVPADFRRRQFTRLRPKLVEHLAERLQAGIARETALVGLAELVRDMAMPAFEAEYLAADASGCERPTTQPPDYRQRLRDLHAEHTQRMEAIRGTPDLDPEMREQLIESEQERFRNQLLASPGERGGA